jgi:hypothetical protein
MKKLFLVGALALLTATSAFAQQAPSEKPLSFVAGFGITVGGDKLATAQYTNGTSQKITAGGIFQFHGGAEYRINPEFSVQGTVGYHADSTSGTNGSITFSRIPVELIGYFHSNDQWRVGAGARFVNNIELSSSGVASGINDKYDNAVGGVFEVEYFTSKKFGLKVRYVKETYKSTVYNYEVDASHVGFFGNFYF